MARPRKRPLSDGRYLCNRCTTPRHPSEFYLSQGFGWCKLCLRTYSRENACGNKRTRRNRLVYARILLEIRIEQESSVALMLQAWATS